MVYKYLFESLLSILLGVYPELELLDHKVVLFKFWRNPLTVLYSDCHFTFSRVYMHKGFSFSAFSPTLVIFWRWLVVVVCVCVFVCV